MFITCNLIFERQSHTRNNNTDRSDRSERSVVSVSYRLTLHFLLDNSRLDNRYLSCHLRKCWGSQWKGVYGQWWYKMHKIQIRSKVCFRQQPLSLKDIRVYSKLYHLFSHLPPAGIIGSCVAGCGWLKLHQLPTIIKKFHLDFQRYCPSH